MSDLLDYAIIAGVLVFWFVLIWRVGVERGWVGLTETQRRDLRRRALLARMVAGFEQLAIAFTTAFAPVMEKTAKAIAEWGVAYERAQSAEIRKLVAQVRAGGSLVCDLDDDDLNRLYCAVARWTNDLGPGDVPEEYAAVVRAMESEQVPA